MRRRGDIVGAVDFGSRAIRVLIGMRDDTGTTQILGHGVAPAQGCVSQGVIQDRNAAQTALRKALAAAEREARVRVFSLFCGVNGKNVETFVREGKVEVSSGLVDIDHITEARDIASRDILAPGKQVRSALTSQEWYVDNLRVINPLGIRGQVLKTRIHFARLPTIIEENIVQCVESQQRELEDMVFLPIAAALGCLTPEDMELGVAVIDMGRSTTGLAVFKDMRILGSHCFEWGGYHITRDVAAGLHISFEEADELVLEYGISDAFIQSELDEDSPPIAALAPADKTTQIKLKTAVPGAQTIVNRAILDEIIFERAKELMVKIRQFLNTKDLMRNLVRGVVLTGGSSVIKNYVALGEAIFRTPCRVGYPGGIEGLPPLLQTPEYSAVVGLIVHGLYYRQAARNGQVDPRGMGISFPRRVGKFLRKYFF